ncbi:hypothetical protein HPP92_013676 [Vanilla planifolia]|uniref:FAF domain-containing protein n=1 Tax=Vanilla planifolia TaxID=51239 RepID=A0A835QV73_VANPL|nr:hypothetical protein HPP92_013676 [Vanilla planifolia]
MLESPSVRQVAVASADGKPYYPSAGFGIGICTESLGCESSEIGIGDDGEEAEVGRKVVGLRSRRRMSEVQFPPPLRWMMGNGGRICRFLKAERRDGRFVLTVVRIDQPPEMMRAFRQDGRLRLELVGTKPGGGQGAIECSEAAAERPTVPLEEKSFSAAGGSSEYGEEAWPMAKARIDGHRCVEAVSDEATPPLWCNHCFVTVVRSPLLGGL